MLPEEFHAPPLPFSLDQLQERTEPRNILLCTPDYFDVLDEKNIHMQGRKGTVDKKRAMHQWQQLRQIYDDLAIDGILDTVSVLDGAPDCEDMVFCANQCLPWQTQSGDRLVVMSNMRHASRQKEVSFFQDFFGASGFKPLGFSGYITFEGMGDVIPHPGKYLLYGGYGYRTAMAAYYELPELLGVPVVRLKLINPRFYHLDTCFLPIDSKSVMICKEAFSNDGLKIIRQLFEQVYLVPEEDAASSFCLNAHLIDLDNRKVAIIQPGSSYCNGILREHGFEIIEADTSEFMKSGGSVFCMKMMYP